MTLTLDDRAARRACTTAALDQSALFLGSPNATSPWQTIFHYKGTPEADVGDQARPGLWAVRHGPYKAHYATLRFQYWVPRFHDPPLLFNLADDLGTRFRPRRLAGRAFTVTHLPRSHALALPRLAPMLNAQVKRPSWTLSSTRTSWPRSLPRWRPTRRRWWSRPAKAAAIQSFVCAAIPTPKTATPTCRRARATPKTGDRACLPRPRRYGYRYRRSFVFVFVRIHCARWGLAVHNY